MNVQQMDLVVIFAVEIVLTSVSQQKTLVVADSELCCVSGKEETSEGETKTRESGQTLPPQPHVHAPLTLKLSWTHYGPLLKHTHRHTNH